MARDPARPELPTLGRNFRPRGEKLPLKRESSGARTRNFRWLDGTSGQVGGPELPGKVPGKLPSSIPEHVFCKFSRNKPRHFCRNFRSSAEAELPAGGRNFRWLGEVAERTMQGQAPELLPRGRYFRVRERAELPAGSRNFRMPGKLQNLKCYNFCK